jgi:hypothetical protein
MYMHSHMCSHKQIVCIQSSSRKACWLRLYSCPAHIHCVYVCTHQYSLMVLIIYTKLSRKALCLRLHSYTTHIHCVCVHIYMWSKDFHNIYKVRHVTQVGYVCVRALHTFTACTYTSTYTHSTRFHKHILSTCTRAHTAHAYTRILGMHIPGRTYTHTHTLTHTHTQPCRVHRLVASTHAGVSSERK